MDAERQVSRLVDHLEILSILILPLLGFAALASRIGGTVLVSVTVLMFINIMLVTGLQIFMGNSGVSSFGHMVFMAIGAYTSSILTLSVESKVIAMPELYQLLAQTHLSFLPALLVAVAVATLVGAVIIFPIMRLEGPTAVISTFSLLIIGNSVIMHWDELTNGVRAIYGVTGYTTIWTSAIFGILSIVIAYWFKESQLGLKLRASRDDFHAAQSIGINIPWVRYIAFLTSLIMTAAAGVLWAHFVRSFSPHCFYLTQTFMVVAMLIIGGSGSISGAVIGTVVVTVILEGLRYIENSVNLAGALPFTLIGLPLLALCVAMMVILILRPRGIMAGREIRLQLKPKGSKQGSVT
jgi:branched-chain amino acid transport system permease protein